MIFKVKVFRSTMDKPTQSPEYMLAMYYLATHSNYIFIYVQFSDHTTLMLWFGSRHRNTWSGFRKDHVLAYLVLCLQSVKTSL